MKAPILLLFASLFCTAPIACGHSMPPDQAIASLRDPSPDTRQHAADSLRTDDGVPPNAIPPLLDALNSEREPKVRGAILITLGKSGRPEAKSPIDQAVQTAHERDTQRWAGRALKYWMIQNNQVSAEYKFPDGWPYGQSGFPPVAQ